MAHLTNTKIVEISMEINVNFWKDDGSPLPDPTVIFILLEV